MMILSLGEKKNIRKKPERDCIL